MAWTGTDSNHTLNIAQVSPSSGNSMLEAYVVGINDASSQAPALAVANITGNTALVIVWTGTDSHHHLNVAFSGDVVGPTAWSGTFVLNEEASGGPSLATWNNTLYIGWSGTDGNHSLNLASVEPILEPTGWANSMSFTAAQLISVNGATFGSSDAPSLNQYGQSQLCMARSRQRHKHCLLL